MEKTTVSRTPANARLAFRRQCERIENTYFDLLSTLEELGVDSEEITKAEKLEKFIAELYTIKIPIKHRFGSRNCIPDKHKYTPRRTTLNKNSADSNEIANLLETCALK